MGAKHPDEEAIFRAARELRSPEERRAYLDKACGDDAELRASVEELLRLHDANRRFLDVPVLAGMTTTLDTSPVSEGPGDVIGRYKLLQQITHLGHECQHPIPTGLRRAPRLIADPDSRSTSSQVRACISPSRIPVVTANATSDLQRSDGQAESNSPISFALRTLMSRSGNASTVCQS